MSLFPLCELCHFLTSDSMKVYRQWVPCERNSSYNFYADLFETLHMVLHGLEMCMWFGYNPRINLYHVFHFVNFVIFWPQIGERGGSVVECRTPEREVRGSKPTAAVLCPWERHFTPRKYWLITQEAMAPSRHDWKIVDWDVKPQHNQPTDLRLYESV